MIMSGYCNLSETIVRDRARSRITNKKMTLRIVHISRFFRNTLNEVFSHNDVERLGQRLHRIKEQWNVSLGIRKSSFD